MPPPWSEPGLATAADRAACRAAIRQGSRSFHAASLLLPPGVRQPAYALYAFCRLADDAIDRDAGGALALARLRRRLDRAYAGRPQPGAIDRALADVLAGYRIPRALPEALLEGLAWDASGRRYDGLPDLQAYAVRVAGTVGAMMALLMGVRAPDAIARACDLGVAMQLTNIARDVGEDARAGRLYLPADWLRSAGIDPDAWLAAPRFDPAVALVVARLLHSAETFYQRALPGMAALPRGCRPAIRAAAALYREIGQEVARRGFDSVSRRAVVPTPRQAWLLARTAAVSPWPGAGAEAPPLDAARFLIDAVAAAPLPSPAAAPPVRPVAAGESGVAWVTELFLRLEQREAVERAGGSA